MSTNPAPERCDPPPAISCHGVTFRYSARPVLLDVNLEIPRGQLTVLMGPNGGGKTTLLKLITGIIEPTAGQVRVLGKRPKQARSKIGYVPQHTTSTNNFPVTVMDVVLMGRLQQARLPGPYSRGDKRHAVEALDAVNMQSAAHRPFSVLSGGQRQRVLIARALVSRPRLLLLDEPTTHLDRRSEVMFFQLLQSLHKKMTILLVTHDISLVSSQVETVVCVRREVETHPAAQLNLTSLRETYGTGINLFRHGQDLPAETSR